MTRLTNKIRTEIVTNWTNAKHREGLLTRYKQFKDDYSQLLNDEFKDGRKVYLNNKKLADNGYISTVCTAQIPYKIRKMWLAGNVICDVLSIDVKDNCLGCVSVDFLKSAHKGKYCQPEQHVNYDSVKELFDQFKADLKIVDDEIDKITSVVYSVNTVKALLELAPEFSKYIPKPASKSTQLININLVNDVKSLL